MANLSKVGGFSFNNFIIDNITYFLLNTIKDATTDSTQIKVKVGIYGTTKEDYREKQRNLVTAIYKKEGKLVFFDDKQVYYMARVTDKIEVQEGYPFNELTITFDLIEPYLYEDAPDVALNVGENIIKQKGNTQSYPIIKLEGNGTITINGVYVEVYNEPVYMDCAREIIYRINEKGKKISHMAFVFGNTFTVLQPGTNYLYMDANGVTATLFYKHTYIG